MKLKDKNSNVPLTSQLKNGFIKKTRKIPEKEIKIAKVRRKEVERRDEQ